VSLRRAIWSRQCWLNRLKRKPGDSIGSESCRRSPEGHENILDHVSVAIDPHMSLHAMSDLTRGFAIVLDQLGFEGLHNKTDLSFLTSDNPVPCFDPTVPEARALPYQVRPPYGSIELLFPIDADTVLRGHTRLRRAGPSRLSHIALTDRQSHCRRKSSLRCRCGRGSCPVILEARSLAK